MNERPDTLIVEELIALFGTGIAPHTPFPKPYCFNASNVRAIYLGCDPTNIHSTSLPYAFALESNLPIFNRFIKGHADSLKQIRLNWHTVYTQNLCQNYFTKETNRDLDLWNRVAAWWIPELKKELLQFSSDIPILMTSEYLYKVLATGKKHKPIEFYECKVDIPVSAGESVIERPLIPLYRHYSYHLSNDRWSRYRQSIVNYLDDGPSQRA